VLPTHATIVQSTFDENFGSETWYNSKLNGDNVATDVYADTWKFVLNASGYSGHTTPTAIFNIQYNPYYNTHTDSTGNAAAIAYQWDYGVKVQESITNVIVDASDVTITSMPNAFMFQLNDQTVRDNTKMALIRINPALASTVSWNQIVITLTSTNLGGGTVTLTPIAGSVLYKDSLAITYTLQTI
jgi:hypothetical protein